ncbi:hypothetical protein NXW24_20800 [Bacteroides fragilis]|nr:hypothetical protein [Bacteroides fragilis]
MRNWWKITNLGEQRDGPSQFFVNLVKVGYAIGTFYGYRSDGLCDSRRILLSVNYITDGLVPQGG